MGCIQENKDRNTIKDCNATAGGGPMGCIQENKDRNTPSASQDAPSRKGNSPSVNRRRRKSSTNSEGIRYG
jgi:hypothetical protein